MIVVYDKPWTPKITLERGTHAYKATIEVEGLDPQRTTTAEERSVGIVALNPPVVQIRVKRDLNDSHRGLLDVGFRALSAAVASTQEGTMLEPGELLMLKLRTVLAMRGAIRLLGEQV